MGSIIKIEMLSTGDEVLYGQITDTNASWLSDFLFQQGLKITSRFTVGDKLEQLVDTLRQRSKANDIIIVNGGLGPTSDDLSAEAAAKANNEELVLHQEWLTVMENYFASRGRPMSPSNIKQAMLPKSAQLVDNPVGTACGFKMLINDCMIFFTPGVPSEFKQMVENEILPDIKKHFALDDKPLCYRLTTMGRSESDLATEIEAKLTIPAGIDVGYRSAMPIIELKLTGKQSQQSQLEQLWSELKILVANNMLYEGTIGLAGMVSELLQQQGKQLIVLEQKTAGLMAYQLYQSNAPIIKSEVVFTQSPDLDIYIQQLNMTDNMIFIGLTDFEQDDNVFKLTLATSSRVKQYSLKYTSRRFNKVTQQDIFAAVGLDAIRRHVLGLDIIGDNIWLELLDG